jgi:hypothetical protein
MAKNGNHTKRLNLYASMNYFKMKEIEYYIHTQSEFLKWKVVLSIELPNRCVYKQYGIGFTKVHAHNKASQLILNKLISLGLIPPASEIASKVAKKEVVKEAKKEGFLDRLKNIFKF